MVVLPPSEGNRVLDVSLSKQFISDYIEIRLLNANYNRLADAGDGTAYSKLFTEDAEFHIVGNQVYKGRDEIASAASATAVTVHVTTEPEITIDGDIATQRVRMIAIYAALDATRNEFVASGWYVDTLKRTEEGWRYFRRRAELDLQIAQVFEKMTITEAFAQLGESPSSSN